MRIIDVEQGTDEWRLARLGKVGASMVADATAKDRSGKGWGVTRAKLVARLAQERLTGQLSETYTNAAMQWGTDTEPQARSTYAFLAGADVQTVGIVLHPNIDGFQCSPDGLVGDDGLVQFKCPESHTHMATLQGAPIDGGYVKQMQAEMACTGRRWCDFVSFDPRWPGEMQLHVRRVERDDDMIRQLDSDIAAFLLEVDETVSRLQRQYLVPMAAE
jgi:hypothetical protein